MNLKPDAKIRHYLVDSKKSAKISSNLLRLDTRFATKWTDKPILCRKRSF